jgi:hypothetical protein
MVSMPKLLPIPLPLILAVSLACGGGHNPPQPPPSVAPTIDTQPAARAVPAGATATFSVTASGTAPLAYQWNRGGAPIGGATSASYTTPATSMADSGASFTVTVSNTAGSITSSAAILTVQAVAPTVATQPANQTVFVGAAATFSVTANGTAPLSYQWNKGGVAIPAATSPVYTTPATLLADSGSSFTVTVTNAGGSVTSSAATLTVQPVPVTATSLAYADPATSTYRLVKNAASSGSHLVLDLVGPATGTASGLSITLGADSTKVAWVDVPAGGTSTTLVQNGTQFVLGAGIPILKAKAAGDVLQATVAQKAPTAAAPLNGPLLRIALDLKPGLGLTPGTVIAFSADAARCQVLDGSGAISVIAVSVGTLTAQ